MKEVFLKEENEIRKKYLKLHAKKSQEDRFIVDEERSFFEEMGFYVFDDKYLALYDHRYNDINEFFYPIVIKSSSGTKLIAYANKFGQFCIYNLSIGGYDCYNNIHILEDMEYIEATEEYAIAIDGDKVQLWEYGKKKDEARIPSEAKYVGYSVWEGYLFRSGDDVYSVQVSKDDNVFEDDYHIPEIVVNRIAKGVKYVILPDYKLNSDAFSQPLFFMKDGTVKAYCQWEGKENSPRDHKSHLVSVQYEGGY